MNENLRTLIERCITTTKITPEDELNSLPDQELLAKEIKDLNLFDILKAYSSIVMNKDFHRMNIPKLPVFTTEDGIKRIKEYFGKLNEWTEIFDLIPKNFLSVKSLKKTGKSGIFAGCLELAKEGNISIKQTDLFEKIYIKENQ